MDFKTNQSCISDHNHSQRKDCERVIVEVLDWTVVYRIATISVVKQQDTETLKGVPLTHKDHERTVGP